ncbi:hypothetical protein Y032_0061g3216 [Ancylostoma ceylanicum]|uniref:Uncharacterized protein n=1 Tax=Ancylostoma ceylanicum TaxID=53326 RepID=A0A016U3M5_9BILA|nr:hypothetical protein Y032_0061g3216 [Ancylostoma ceylanicum]
MVPLTHACIIECHPSVPLFGLRYATPAVRRLGVRKRWKTRLTDGRVCIIVREKGVEPDDSDWRIRAARHAHLFDSYGAKHK